MIKSNGSLKNTKEIIKNYFEKEVEVRVNLGRNKFTTFKGKVTNIYPALFTITPLEDFNGKTSFSYSELMCGIVALKEIE